MSFTLPTSIRQVTLCGGGNAVHTMIPLLAAKNIQVNIFAPFGDEAERLAPAVTEGITLIDDPNGRVERTGRAHRISREARDVVPGSQLVLVPLPSFAHPSTLAAVTPFLDPHAVVGVLPAQGGVEWRCKRGAEGVAEGVAGGGKFVMFGTDKLPYNCRIVEYGRKVELFGVKKVLGMATLPASVAPSLSPLISDLLDMRIAPRSHMLSITMHAVNQIIHPGRMYGLFHAWDGKPMKENPLFYQVDQASADLLEAESLELVEIAKGLAAKSARGNELGFAPEVVTLHKAQLDAYEDFVEDPSTLASTLRTNTGYYGIHSPMKKTESGEWIPDFNNRYLTEDVPFGLCVLKGLAELAGVKTPNMDKVTRWAQERLGKEYIDSEGRLTGANAGETGAPQNFGIHSVDDLFRID